MLNNILEISGQPQLNDSAFTWMWLKNLIGTDAATAVQSLILIAVYGLCIYIVSIQVIRLLNNFSNKNAEDAKARGEARENIKASFFIIGAVALIGGFGFTAVFFLLNKWLPEPDVEV
jgi:nitrate reductase NapE component